MNKELVTLISIKKHWLARAKGSSSDTTVRAQGTRRDSHEKVQDFCAHTPLTFQFWLAITLLGFNTNSILFLYLLMPSKGIKCLKSQYTFVETIVPTLNEYSGFLLRVRILNVEKTLRVTCLISHSY